MYGAAWQASNPRCPHETAGRCCMPATAGWPVMCARLTQEIEGRQHAFVACLSSLRLRRLSKIPRHTRLWRGMFGARRVSGVSRAGGAGGSVWAASVSHMRAADRRACPDGMCLQGVRGALLLLYCCKAARLCMIGFMTVVGEGRRCVKRPMFGGHAPQWGMATDRGLTGPQPVRNGLSVDSTYHWRVLYGNRF